MEQYPQPNEQDQSPSEREAWHRPTTDEYIAWLQHDIRDILEREDGIDDMPDVVSRHGGIISDIWERKVYGSVEQATRLSVEGFQLGREHEDYDATKLAAAGKYAHATSWAILYKASFRARAEGGSMGDAVWQQCVAEEVETVANHLTDHPNIAYSPQYTLGVLDKQYREHELAVRNADAEAAIDTAHAILLFIATKFHESTERFGLPPQHESSDA